jgi:hypothetical protein
MVYIALFVILAALMFAGAFFVYRGFRMNIARGVRNNFVLLFVTLISIGTANFFSRDYESLPLAGAFMDTIREALTDFGIYTPTMETVLNATAQRITYTLLIAVFFVVLFTIAVVSLTIYDHVRKDFRVSAFKHRRIFNTGLSALTGGYLILFALFAPPINVAAEAPIITDVIETVQVIQSGDMDKAMDSISIIADALMNTNIIAADETTRIDLIQSALVAGAAKQSDPMVAALLEGITFNSGDDFKNEAAKMQELIRILALDGITMQMLNQPRGLSFETFRGMTHTTELADALYSMSNYDALVRTILTTGVRTFTGDRSFNYPADMTISPDSKDEFASLLIILPELYNGMELRRAGTLSADDANRLKQDANTLMNYSFISPEAAQKIADYLGVKWVPNG